MHSKSPLQQQLLHRMQDLGLSANAIEKRAGLKPSAVQNILQGKSKRPAALLLQAIAKELNCTTADLLEELSPASSENVHMKGKEKEEWDSQLYVESIQTVEALLTQNQLKADKANILKYAEEVYRYSLSTGTGKVDHHFAAWLIHR